MRVRVAIAGAVIGTTAGVALSRVVRWWRTWGIDASETARELPGDGLIAEPTAIETRGLTIDAPPEAVWPWLVQMGYGRAGWYSYDRMDMRGRSAVGLVPAWQTLVVGDRVGTGPGTGFEVRLVEPNRALVLYLDTALVTAQMEAKQAAETAGQATPAGLAASGAMLRATPPEFAASWAFSLEPVDGGRTRLIERLRYRTEAAAPAQRLAVGLLGFGVFLMTQRQMRGIRERAERTVVAPPVVTEMAPESAETTITPVATSDAPPMKGSHRIATAVG